MKKRPRPDEPPALTDGWYWTRLFIQLRGGGFNYEWRIARVEGGRVQPFGMTEFLEPTHRYLRHALWHGPIEPPPLDEATITASALARSGKRQRRTTRRAALKLPAEESRTDTAVALARVIVNAFVQTSDDLREMYAAAPEKLNEVVQRVAALIARYGR